MGLTARAVSCSCARAAPKEEAGKIWGEKSEGGVGGDFERW